MASMCMSTVSGGTVCLGRCRLTYGLLMASMCRSTVCDGTVFLGPAYVCVVDGLHVYVYGVWWNSLLRPGLRMGC